MIYLLSETCRKHRFVARRSVEVECRRQCYVETRRLVPTSVQVKRNRSLTLRYMVTVRPSGVQLDHTTSLPQYGLLIIKIPR